MHLGTVKWFSDESGEGCIVPDEGGEELFVCFTGVAPSQGGAFEVLRRGARVVYEVVIGETVLRAENVRRLG
jgi:cold shock CspA family protein